MVKILQEGKKGYYSTAGVRMEIEEEYEKRGKAKSLRLENSGENEEVKSLYLPSDVENYLDLRVRVMDMFDVRKNVYRKDNSSELIK